MSDRHNHQLPFSPLYDYYIRIPFTYEGHNYVEHEAFPKPNADGSKHVVPPRLLRQLYEQRRITAVPPLQAPLPPAPADPAASGAPKTEPSVDNTGSAPPAPPTVSIKHKGFGRWYVVDENGENRAGPYNSAEEAHQHNPQVPMPQKE